MESQWHGALLITRPFVNAFPGIIISMHNANVYVAYRDDESAV